MTVCIVCTPNPLNSHMISLILSLDLLSPSVDLQRAASARPIPCLHINKEGKANKQVWHERALIFNDDEDQVAERYGGGRGGILLPMDGSLMLFAIELKLCAYNW